MIERDDGGPAFPFKDSTAYAEGMREYPGMSLRDWFAGQALAALSGLIVANPRAIKMAATSEHLPEGTTFDDYLAIRAGHIADAMIAARKLK